MPGQKASKSALLATAVLLALLAWAAYAGALMLLMGAAHATVSESIPAIGYGGALVLSQLLYVAGVCLGLRSEPVRK